MGRRGITIIVVGEPGSAARTVTVPVWALRALVLAPLSLVLVGMLVGWELRAPVARAETRDVAPRTMAEADAPKPEGVLHAMADDLPPDELEEPEPVVPRPAPGCSGRKVPDRTGFGMRVALTFDDGPDAETTPRVLETLRDHDVPAAFFINGERVDDRTRPIVHAIAKDPSFVLASHGWSHENMTRLSADELARSIDDNTNVIRASGVEPRYFRFPFGVASCEAMRTVRERGQIVTGWHVSSADWCFAERDGYCHPARYRWVPRAMRRDMPAFVLRQVRRRSGGIVLMHDRIPYTADALGHVITTLRAEGYRFTTLDDAAAFPKLNGRVPDVE